MFNLTLTLGPNIYANTQWEHLIGLFVQWHIDDMKRYRITQIAVHSIPKMMQLTTYNRNHYFITVLLYRFEQILNIF